MELLFGQVVVLILVIMETLVYVTLICILDIHLIAHHRTPIGGTIITMQTDIFKALGILLPILPNLCHVETGV